MPEKERTARKRKERIETFLISINVPEACSPEQAEKYVRTALKQHRLNYVAVDEIYNINPNTVKVDRLSEVKANAGPNPSNG